MSLESLFNVRKVSNSKPKLQNMFYKCDYKWVFASQTPQRKKSLLVPYFHGSAFIFTYKAHLHWQKTKSKKPVPFTLPEKPITCGVFGTKSACAKKPESHTCVLVSGAHARLLSTFDRTRVVRITLRAAVGWFRWRSRTTWPKTRIIPARLERAFTLAKNQWNFGGVSKNHAAEVGFSIRVFWNV